MDAIEKRARDIQARLREQVNHHRDLCNPLYMSGHGRLLHEAAEIIAALTPPEGFVLVPVNPTVEMAVAGNEAESEGKFATEIYGAMLDARPEVKP